MEQKIRKYKVKFIEFKYSAFQKKDSKTALLRQRIVTKTTHEKQQFESTENRVAFITVPANTTVKEMKQQLISHQDCCIYRIISNHPILSPTQSKAINDGLKTIHDYALRQVVRWGKGHKLEGLPITLNDKVLFRVATFSWDKHEDSDLRTYDPDDQYQDWQLLCPISDDIFWEIKPES